MPQGVRVRSPSVTPAQTSVKTRVTGLKTDIICQNLYESNSSLRDVAENCEVRTRRTGKTTWKLNRSAGFSHLHRRVEQLVARQSHNLEVAGAKPASAPISTYWGSDANIIEYAT